MMHLHYGMPPARGSETRNTPTAAAAVDSAGEGQMRLVRGDDTFTATPADGESRRPALRCTLRDRKIVKWALAYLGVVWMLLEAMDVLSDIWGWPLPLQRMVCLTLGLGFLPLLVVAWYHGEQGRQRVTRCEFAMLTALLLTSGAVLWMAGAREAALTGRALDAASGPCVVAPPAATPPAAKRG